MAELVNGQIKLSNGSLQTPSEGAWYDGRRYLNGQLLGVNEYEPGKYTSNEVNAQSAAAQGVSVQQFSDYLSQASASNVTSSVTPSYTTGALNSNVSSIQSSVDAARKALETRLATDQAKNEADMAAARAKEDAALAKVQELTTPFREEKETTLRAQYGTEEVLTEQRSLLTELEQLLTEGNNLIKQQQEVTGLSSVRNPRIQKTMEDVTARAGVIQAVVSLQNTYLSNAYTAIDRTVSAIAQDRQDQLSYYNTVLSLANRDIISLDAESKSIANEQINLLKGDLESATQTANYIKELMINPSTASLIAQAGVTLNDSVETVNSKLALATYSNEVKEMANSMSTSGYTAITDPSTVSASQLVTLVDSKGKTYYYKKNSSNTTTTSNDYYKSLTTVKTTSSSSAYKSTAPSYTPSGGSGSIYIDPTDGTIWQYTNTGWIKVS